MNIRMKRWLKIRVANSGEITEGGVSTPAAERIWYEVLHPIPGGYRCKLASDPICVPAPLEMDITYDMVLDELEMEE